VTAANQIVPIQSSHIGNEMALAAIRCSLRMTRKADERMLGAASMKSNTKKSGIWVEPQNSFFSPVTPLQNRKKLNN